MGPVVLYVDNSEYSIVDGQQRLTSFVLIMIYLNHQYNNILKIKNKFEGYIYSEHYGTQSYNMNIPERDRMLNFLHNGTEFDDSILKNESCKAILERYNDITELFPPSLLEPNVFPLFTNWLTEKLVFIEILTQTSESAYTIFETMNDRGLNLTQTELLKSFLLSNVKDEIKIKELDSIWKNKISLLNTVDDDQDFFKAWLRAKYAMTIRTSEKDSENKDFEKIGTRFSSWTQENTKVKDQSESNLLLDIKDPNSFYFFVKSDFNFFSDIYLQLRNFEISDNLPEHRFKLLSYRGVSPSLSYPLVLSPIHKTDIEDTINKKIDLVVKYIDSFGAYRMLLAEPITHSSIRNAIYLKIKEIRNADLSILLSKLTAEINEYKVKYLNDDYTRFDSNSKYILSRLYNNRHPEIEFASLYFQRRRDSFVLYQLLKAEDFESEKLGLHKGLKDRILISLCSYTMVPKHLVIELNNLTLVKRILKLLSIGSLFEFADSKDIDLNNLKDFFMKREKRLKELVITNWKM